MITFRPLNANIPPCWLSRIHWQVEFWPDDVDTSRPYGIAYVSDFGADVYLDYVLVCDDMRRRGVATALLEAIEARWPDIIHTDTISPEGAALCAKFYSKKSE